MKYRVTVTRTESAVVDVEADDEEDAEAQGYSEAIANYESHCWETMSIDTSAKAQGEDEGEDEGKGEDAFAALTELAELERRYRSEGPA